MCGGLCKKKITTKSKSGKQHRVGAFIIMKRIKLGKGLLRSLFPSNSNNSKKKSSSKRNKSSSSAAAGGAALSINNGQSSSAFNCPTILGAARRKKNDQQPYELHQEGASLPPSSDDEGRDHEGNAFDGSSGVGEKERELDQQLQVVPDQQQQESNARREANVSSPITVACTLSEEKDEVEEEVAWNKMIIADKFEAIRKVEVEAPVEKLEKQQGENAQVEVEAPVEKQQDDNENCELQLKHQVDESFDTALDHQAYSVTSPGRDEARRRAIARQQRILSQASTRFQALSEAATIDTSGYSYSSPPHLQRRRWQQHIGRHTRPQMAVADKYDGNPQLLSSSQGHHISIGLLPNQQKLHQTTKNYSSVVFYDATPTRDPSTNNSSDFRHERKQKEDQFSSPTCVADMVEQFEVITRGDGNIGVVTRNSMISSNNSNGMRTATDNNIHFFILLLCPHSRIFELIEVSDAPVHSTVGDVLKLIPHHVTDERLLKEKFIGLCRPADRTEFIDLRLPAFLMTKEGQGEDCKPFDYIHENDVLVAILKGSTCYQMCKISKTIRKNPKFKEMIRRRRRRSAADKATRNKKKKSKQKHTEKLNSPTEEIYVPDDCSVVSGITYAKPVRSSVRSKEPQRGREDPTSLCKMLETLSKKLHEAEKEDEVFLSDGDNSSMGSGGKQRSVDSGFDEVKRGATAETSSHEGLNIAFKMSPKMLAMELAQTIEDIFADNNVEIVAVDTDDNDGYNNNRIDDDDDNDNDSFVSARSHRTKSSAGTLKSTKSRPRIVSLNNKTKTSTRQFKFAETMEDNALAAQIEAMAVQADAAFEDRNKHNSAETTGVIDQTNGSKEAPVTEAAVFSTEESVTEVDCGTHDLEESFETTFEEAMLNIDGDDMEGVTKVTNRASKDAIARKFLNASTSTVSKMVAANQGRVNEVHVLESLGCTIVCIAANYMQSNRQSGRSSSIKTIDVLQSATFLAFVVSGQRYLAKITQK